MPTAAQLRSAAPTVLARAVLTLPYWWSGLSMLAHWKAAMAQAAPFGLAPAGLTMALMTVVQIGGSVLLIAGCHASLAAGALAVFTIMESLAAPRFWEIGEPMERFYATSVLLHHIALIGGLFLAAAMLNRARRRP